MVAGDIVDYEPELPAGDLQSSCRRRRNRAYRARDRGDGTGGRAAGGAGAAGVPGKSCTSGTVVALHPRRNYIIRRASNLSKESHIIAANIDRALLVVSLVRPATRTAEFIDRLPGDGRGVPHSGGDPASNKSDLYIRPGSCSGSGPGLSKAPYRAGYDVVRLSASRGEVLRINPRARGGRKRDGSYVRHRRRCGCRKRRGKRP
ncbi:MAG: hypothetical protein ACLR8Y_07835 [Alistipes indistinctus]